MRLKALIITKGKNAMKNIAGNITMIAVILLTAVGLAEADDYSWVGGSDNQYSNSANWSPNGDPVGGDTAIFNSGSVNHLSGIDLVGKTYMGSLQLTDTASDVVLTNGTGIRVFDVNMSSAAHDLSIETTGGTTYIGDGLANVINVTAGRTFTYAAAAGVGSTLGLQSSSLTLNGAGTVNFGMRNVSVSGILNVSAGTLNITGDTKQSLLMWAGNNTINQSGGTVNAGEVVVANSTNPHENIYNLTGGTLQAERVYNAKTTGGTGSFVFDGGTLQAKANGTDFLSSTLDEVRIDAGGATIDSAAFEITAAKALSGSGGLTKIGEGTLTLDAANSYDGGTQIDAGELLVGASGLLGSGDVTAGANTLLTLQNSSAIDSSANLILDAAALLDLDFSGTNFVNQLSLDGGETWLAAGTYGAEQDNITGSGIISVAQIPEPATIGLFATSAALAFFFRRMLTV